MRPAILQTLTERARDVLTKGEVRILDAADEASLRDRPRLVIALVLKKQTDNPPAVTVHADLYEKVRLSRDPAKELVLSTWNADNVAPEVTEKSLVSIVERQLHEFIKAYQSAKAKSPQPATTTIDLPTSVQENANSLAGLNGIGFLLSIPAQIQNGEFGRNAEEKLRRAGIVLLRSGNEGRDGPLLIVTLNESSSDEISVSSTLFQRVRLAHNPQIETFMPTWNSYTIQGGPITEETLRRIVNSQLDRFIEAYKAANPRSSASN